MGPIMKGIRKKCMSSLVFRYVAGKRMSDNLPTKEKSQSITKFVCMP
ncbi:hypothetical protein SAMN02745724_04482 [Pseudoalteromonas denitrificans DSM 6059]|jgi:hypothetical protein|uniref:Uncharacterized protein n=1 Tax=Pseudoalteromonas denitrificans DSM 6059 TaxID=1123010 RepID=A0A1I1S777_9GAMM|nr:hypothetical protein SAMN02745724_04482 [Pseudoalteromonas denitrificans DSM 6059]